MIAATDRHDLIAGPTSDSPAAKERIAELEEELKQSWKTIARMHKQLQAFESSHGWRWLKRYYTFRNFLLPRGSLRHRLAVNALRQVRSWSKFLIKELLLRQNTAEKQYLTWIRKNEPTAAALDEQRRHVFAKTPLISILVPTYNTPPPILDEMIGSVLDQTYANWELCIADASDADHEARQLLKEKAAADPRFKVTFLHANGGIAANTNAALALARGDFIALLDHDDTLAPFALFEVVQAVNDNPQADFFYSDEDKIDETGRKRWDPHFKPDWSPDALRSHNYICHLSVFARPLMAFLGGLRHGLDGSQDYDLILRATEQACSIVHIRKVLYHWRVHEGSAAGDPTAKMYAYLAARRALAGHLERVGLEGAVENGLEAGTYRIRHALPSWPLVSIIIPTKDNPRLLATCIRSLDTSTYKNVEMLLVENDSKKPETFALYRELERRPDLRLLTWSAPFNFAAVNNFAAAHARGDVLLFLNNDIEVISPDWQEEMLGHLLRPGVGVVGAKLYYPDGNVQHGGVILGIGGLAGHAHLGYPRNRTGYMNRLIVAHNLSAVTGACMMMRRELFNELGGFDERFILAFNDLDLCMRVRKKGLHVIWTPFAELYHHESKTRGVDFVPRKAKRLQREIAAFQSKWGKELVMGDPYYSPNLTLETEDFALRI